MRNKIKLKLLENKVKKEYNMRENFHNMQNKAEHPNRKYVDQMGQKEYKLNIWQIEQL